MSELNNLLELAEDDRQSSYRRRQAVSDLLKKHPAEERTLGVVKQLLSGNDNSLKRDIVGVLKDFTKPEILPLLKPLLSTDDDYLRRDAIQLIGKTGGKDEIALVEALTTDASFTVSYAAKTALSEIERRIVQNAVPETAAEEEPEEVEEIPQTEIQESAELEEATEEVEEIPQPANEESAELEEAVEEEPEEVEEADEEFEEKAESVQNADKKEPAGEIKPHEQKLPASLHDNSIFGSESIAEVNKKVSDEIESDIFETAPILTVSANAGSSPNLKQFFNEETHLALALYKQLATYSEALPAKEAAVSETKRQLTLLEADKADDVQASQESIKTEQGDVDEIKWQIKKAQKDFDDYEKSTETVLSSLLFMFSADKKDEVVAHKAGLKKKIRELNEQLLKEESELTYHKTEKKSLLEPIIELRRQLEVKVKERDAVIEKVVAAERDINELITRLLLKSDKAGLEERLAFLDESKSPMAGLATGKIISLVSKLRRDELNAEELQLQYEESVKAASDKLDSLGDELSRCLVKKETSVKKEVEVNVSVGFKEEESFFSFSNASGSASGSGTAGGTMKVEELLWSETPNLQNSIDEYAAGFHNLGVSAAARELGDIAYHSSSALLNSYIDYLRTLIEADFGA